MSTSTVTSTAALASASSDDGADSNAYRGVREDNTEGLVVFSVGGTLLGCLILVGVCAVVRVRMVRRRRLVLGLPPPLALRRLMKEEMKDWKPKPVIYGVWADLRDDDHSLRDRSQQWGELHPLSLSKILSESVPRKPNEKRNVFGNYTTSILELFSVERMDKALLESIQREDPTPTPEYTKSELAATFLVAMPRATGYDAMEGVSLLPELEVGVTSVPGRLDSCTI